MDKKVDLIRDMIKNLDWIEKNESVCFIYGLDRKFLNSVYNSGLDILSDLNDGRLTNMKRYRALQWKIRFSDLVDNITLELRLYSLHLDLKSLLKKI